MLEVRMDGDGPCQCPQDTYGGVPTGTLINIMMEGQIQVYREWIAKGHSVNASMIVGYNMFYAASVGGHTHILKELIQHPKLHMNLRSIYGNTAFMAAARWGKTDTIRFLLSTKPMSNCRLDVTAKDSDGLTALAIAAQYKRWNALHYLLVPGIEYDKKNLDIALHETMNDRKWDLVTCLLQNYQGFCTQNLNKVLLGALDCREIQILRLVLTCHYSGCDRKSLNSIRMLAVKTGYIDAEILLTNALNGFYDIPMPYMLNKIAKPLFEYDNTELQVEAGEYSNMLRFGFHKIMNEKAHDGRSLSENLDTVSSPVSQQSRNDPFTSALPSPINYQNQLALLSQNLVNDTHMNGVFCPNSLQQAFAHQVGKLQLNVIPVKTPVQPGPDVYDTTSNPRGIVLILNYNEFYNRPDMLREGSYLDVLNMRNLCDQMGYECQVHYNLTSDQTVSILDAFRRQKRLSHVSSVLVAIMSHGISRHTFYTSDMNTVTVNEVQNLFLDNQCPLMKNKPKIFLFNFCRGLDIPASLETDAVREQPRNILCIYSTTESFLSYRDRNKGCPFVVALCEVLSNHAHEMDLDNLIRKFQQKYLPNTTPEIQNLGFYKKFFFNPIGSQIK